MRRGQSLLNRVRERRERRQPARLIQCGKTALGETEDLPDGGCGAAQSLRDLLDRTRHISQLAHDLELLLIKLIPQMGSPSGNLLPLPKHPGFGGADHRPKRDARIRADLSDGVLFEAELGRDLSVRCPSQRLPYHLLATSSGHSTVADGIAVSQNHAVAAAGVVDDCNADAELVGNAPD
ncbi:MAG: hypothetical protein JNK58_08910 [Phycisphaerae bacterium]|nr:hypothetical protein [Phycisphaerae bacterium]